MKYYRNKDGGAIMTEADARNLWRNHYDGGVLSFNDQFEDVTDALQILQARPTLYGLIRELAKLPKDQREELTAAALAFLDDKKATH